MNNNTEKGNVREGSSRGSWRKVLGRFKKRALTPCEREQQRTKGKCQRRFFQGVTGGHFQESSINECLPAVKVNNAAHTQEMSEKVLPGGHWMNILGKFKHKHSHSVNVNNNTHVEGNVREGSSRGSLEEGSGKVQKASARIHWQCCQK